MKAIETEYKGYKFRSRLEARWAVFFDACGVDWEYEPEGFELDNGKWYLPDFLVHNVKVRNEEDKETVDVWFEVKGDMADEDLEKISYFEKEHMIIVVGRLPDGKFEGELAFTFWFGNYYNEHFTEGFYSYRYLDGDEYPACIGVTKMGQITIYGPDHDFQLDTRLTEYAFAKARQERFDSISRSVVVGIEQELENCKIGLDLNNANDKVTFLKRVVSVISSFKDPLQREVYISKVSREADIMPEILREQVEHLVRNKSSIRWKSGWKSIEQIINPKDEINPEAAKYPTENRAEEFIICYTIKNPDKLDDILSQISPDEFVTGFNRKVFAATIKAITSTIEFSVSFIFLDGFSEPEMMAVLKMIEKNHEITISERTLQDCINVLKSFKKSFVYNKGTDLSGEEIRILQEHMKHKI